MKWCVPKISTIAGFNSAASSVLVALSTECQPNTRRTILDGSFLVGFIKFSTFGEQKEFPLTSILHWYLCRRLEHRPQLFHQFVWIKTQNAFDLLYKLNLISAKIFLKFSWCKALLSLLFPAPFSAEKLRAIMTENAWMGS